MEILSSFSLEVVGRFPRPGEAESLQISDVVPVWLPAGSSELGEPIKSKIRNLRDLSLKLNACSLIS